MNKIYRPGVQSKFKKAAIFLVMVFSLILSQPAAFSSPAGGEAGEASKNSFQDSMAEATSETVKAAISPLLVLFVNMASRQVQIETADDKDGAGHSEVIKRRFLLAAVGIVLLLIFLKDGLSVTPLSPVKKAGDAVEAQAAPLAGLVGLAAILPGLISQFAPEAAVTVQGLINGIGPARAYAALEPDMAAAGFSAVAEWLGGAAVTVASTIVYSAVWLVSNSLIVLCLVVPAPLGLAVKSFRLTLLGFLHTLSLLHPWLALFFSIFIIIIAFSLYRWTFKLTVWSLFFSFDLLTRGWRKHKPGREPAAFIASGGRKALKLGQRTYGRLSLENGRLFFRYRRFLVFPKKVELPPLDRLVLGRRLLGPVLLMRVESRHVGLLAFRLSCRTHEESLARQLGGLEVLEVGLGKWLRGAWSGLEGGFPRFKADAAPASEPQPIDSF